MRTHHLIIAAAAVLLTWPSAAAADGQCTPEWLQVFEANSCEVHVLAMKNDYRAFDASKLELVDGTVAVPAKVETRGVLAREFVYETLDCQCTLAPDPREFVHVVIIPSQPLTKSQYDLIYDHAKPGTGSGDVTFVSVKLGPCPAQPITIRADQIEGQQCRNCDMCPSDMYTSPSDAAASPDSSGGSSDGGPARPAAGGGGGGGGGGCSAAPSAADATPLLAIALLVLVAWVRRRSRAAR